MTREELQARARRLMRELGMTRAFGGDYEACLRAFADVQECQPGGLRLRDFGAANRRRCESARGFGHALESWSLSDWLTATAGELGEAANVVKKLNRVRDGIGRHNRETPEELRAALADEIADTFIYLDLLAQAAGFSLEDAVLAKFERTSEKIGYTEAA